MGDLNSFLKLYCDNLVKGELEAVIAASCLKIPGKLNLIPLLK